MNEKISYIKLPNITTNKLQDVVDFLEDNEIEYVEYYEEDLQKRIDNAVEYINADYINGKVDGLSWLEVHELLDILKESGE